MKATLDMPQPQKERESAQPAPSRRRTTAPRPDFLGRQACLDGSAAQLTWQPLPDAQEYHVQVARTPRFEDLLFDETVGDSTSVTLYELLPTDGARFHWRVRARTAEGWTPFSPSAACLAVTDEEAEAWQKEHAEREAARADVAREERLAPEAVTALPYQSETTTVAQVMVFLALVLSVVLGLLLLNFL